MIAFHPVLRRLDDYASAIAPLVAGVACLRVRTWVDARSRRAWLLLGLSALSWAAAGTAWAVLEVNLGREIPSLID